MKHSVQIIIDGVVFDVEYVPGTGSFFPYMLLHNSLGKPDLKIMCDCQDLESLYKHMCDNAVPQIKAWCDPVFCDPSDDRCDYCECIEDCENCTNNCCGHKSELEP